MVIFKATLILLLVLDFSNLFLIKRTIKFILMILGYEASRGAAARGVNVKPTDCEFDPHSRR